MKTDLTPRKDRFGVFPVEVPWESIPRASKTFTQVHLRLLMKEREDAMARMIELDQPIWELEESFRGET